MTKITQYFKNVFSALKDFLFSFFGLYIPRPERGYFFNVSVSFDELLNAISGGHPDETISSRASKARNNGKGWGCILCKVLNFFEEDHCDKVILFTIRSNADIQEGECNEI